MSRAFVNEDNAAADAEQPVERLVSAQTNYVTAYGLTLLKEHVGSLQAQHSAQNALGEATDKQRLADLERDLRYFTQRLQSAQVVAPALSTEKVQIGSWITFTDEEDNHQRVQLVGEDQADATRGLINWGSPLGSALLGAQKGDEVMWKRPAGDQTIEVLLIEPDH
ncbi:GreA/GreB family elongation factor [Pseudomonas syringae pv. actinidiae]|uniref:Transcription elongation factor n=1 Tax=Pseudomonas syringae pv. actinidiae TaxID=103796 RepID=Q0EE13_PSESF|nr:GreA/GreB family elongation factor [Pseudomonas syringae]AQL39516.1 transcription elongation factor GreAB [Pseudomonas syringae pv. actinidiae ICMP 9853]EGH65553.1 transcription elongation factor GreB [Pseudomonas syringae pv. actinidiae str. M302091]EPM44866.1 transcription elongation factor GreB [Pseudomonas syringae pv. actinidiae ICMP 19103]EPN00174.1 transcription elongation factor GreB [Pseudomonas syringae pv. actinidiae ICMP 19102]EPN07721.1 transcription elongation factor GreB [Pse